MFEACSSSPSNASPAIDPLRLAAIDRFLIAALKDGNKAKRRAINKVLELVPQWRRSDCWRRLRQLRRRPELAALVEQERAALPLRRERQTGRPPARPWTEAEDDRLLNWAGYEPVRKIAQRLGRSQSAVRFRMGALGMSAKMKDGFSLRSLRKLLCVSPSRLRWLIGTGRLRVRDARIRTRSLAQLLAAHPAWFDAAAGHRLAAAQAQGDEACSWDRAASILGVASERIQNLICSADLKVFDPFVSERQFEEFCKKHGHEFNLRLMDAAVANWLVSEYGVPKPAAGARTASPAQKHVLVVRQCKCGKKIAGNAYFRHANTCARPAVARQLSMCA